MLNVEEAISQVERLYRSLTGKELPASEPRFAPIPPEKDPVQHVEQQLAHLMEALGPIAATTPEVAWLPPVSLAESPQELVVHFDLPGMKREEVDVEIGAAAIVVRGTRTPPAHDGGAWIGRANERVFGPFRRVVGLPPGLLVEQANATLRDGVLEIRIPRGASTNGQRLQVS